MGTALHFTLTDKATPALQDFIARVKSRRAMNLLVGRRVQNRLRDHLIGLSRTRHATADRLGAKPSGHLGKAAEKVSQAENVRADEQGVSIALNHPGLARAFGEVTIVPVRAKALTIPLIAEAYNRRAGRVPGLFIPKRKPGSGKTNVLVKKKEDGTLEAWYLLVPRVVQKQDRTLLPSDQEIETSALQGVTDTISLIQRKQLQ